MPFARARFFLIPASLCAFLLTGCTLTTTAPDVPVASQGPAVQGKVYGGQQPVVGAQVYLYATGTTAYAGPGIAASTSNASTSLLTAAVLVNSPGNSGLDTNGNYYVTTKADGSFSITGDYACTLGTGVYIYVTGGNPGAGTNSASGFLAALGACPSAGGNFASSNPGVIVNEVSTIGTAYALAGFATDATHISNSGTTLGKQGMANAFASPVELYNASSGSALATTPMGNGTVPQKTINTLANILAACVNSTGPTSSACSTIFTDTGTSSTLDMATAAVKIAQSPSVNGHVSDLFALQTALSPFPTDLSSAPNDYAVGIKFTGGGLKNPVSVAIDGTGNVWAANNGAPGSISELNGSTGQAISGSNGFTGGGISFPTSLAVDVSGNVWVTSPVGGVGAGSISEFNSSGTAISPSSGYYGGQIDEPDAIAVDSSGNVWVISCCNSSLVEFNSSGTVISGYSTGAPGPRSVAIDASGNIWVSNQGSGHGDYDIGKISSGGTLIGSYTGGGLSSPNGIAVDATGNVWVTDGTGALTAFNSSGTAISPSGGYTGGGIGGSFGTAIDGAGSIWIANANSPGNGSLSAFSNSGTALSGSNGYRGGGLLSTSESIGIDGSGNVWIGNQADNSLTEFIGIAVPVVTPLQYGVANNKIATRP